MTKKQIKSIEVRVKRGVKWLNKNHKGWYKKIDLRIFTMSNPHVCVCGQVFKEQLHLGSGFNYFSSKYSETFAKSLGFERLEKSDYSEYDTLAELWTKEITKLQKKP